MPASPSVAKIAALFTKEGAHGPSGLTGETLPHHFQMQDPKDSNDHDEIQEVSDITIHGRGLGAREKSRNSQSTVESGEGSGPPDKGSYKRFNGKEQKEREEKAENWIPALWKKRMESNRKVSKQHIPVVNKDTFLFEYAMYIKDNSFIGNIRKAVAGMVVRQPGFTCCSRGTSDAGKPAWDTDHSSLSDQGIPKPNEQAAILQILSDYLIQVSKVANDVKEEVIKYTFDNGLFSAFITEVEQKVFNNFEDFPNYDWDNKAKMSILQNEPKFKGSSCQRNEHLVYLYNHLAGCEKFFWRVYKVIKTVAGERLRDQEEEVVDTLQILTRLRQLEFGQKLLEDRQCGQEDM